MKKHIDTISKGAAKPNTETPEVAAPVEKTVPAEPVTTPPPPPAPTPTPEVPSAPTPTTAPATTELPPDTASTDSFETMFPEPSVAISGPPSWIWWVLLLVATVILAFVGYSLTHGKLDSWLGKAVTPSPTTTITPTTTPTPVTTASATPTATPTATPSSSATTGVVNKASITIRVLNGTTITGAAGTAKNVLEKAGFTVHTTGNAKTQNYTSTFVYYQTGKKAEADAVKDALSNYSVTEQESTLANPDNILVIIGKK